jgi:putative DNA primase/helicase
MIQTKPELLNSSTIDVARQYVTVGLSPFPIKLDGTKEPAFSGWRAFAERVATDRELTTWFWSGRFGIGITGGTASGNLIVLDFETIDGFRRWGALLNEAERAALARSPVIRTPKGGRHVYVRTTEPVRGCKLARTVKGETLIETRGCQHYVVAPGSPPSVHSTGIPYTVARAGWLDGGPFAPMPVRVFNGLAVKAAELNEYTRPSRTEVVGDCPVDTTVRGDRPGDHFNARATWGDILRPHRWTVFRSTPEATYWSRPGKSPVGVSASTGHCKGPSGNDLFYVFSTSAAPFEAETSYSRFAVYALLYHQGDFTAATRALGWAGYGNSARKVVSR